ncbi:MAG: radical SAM protein [Actinobacteria bacterium]|nr:radical SAM protein [Actinomycetota bacterium]
MKVLLINENRCRESIVPYPLGLAYISSAVKEAGHEAAGLDLMLSENIERDIVGAVHGFEPDLIGLSIRNIDNQDSRNTMFYVEDVKIIVDLLRKHTNAPVIPGGAGFSIFPLECLEYLGLEFGVAGEGEKPFTELLACVNAGKSPQNLPGVAFFRNGRGRVNTPIASTGFTASSWPDRNTFNPSDYNWSPGKNNFASNLQSRRGCPMHCIYCSTGLVGGRISRRRDTESVARELESLEFEHGMGAVWFADDLFNHPPDYTRALCEAIKQMNLSIKWTCTYNPAAYEPGQFELMREAGCFAASIGNESGSEDILNALKKGFGREMIVRSIEEAKSAGIRVTCFLLLGGPGETKNTVDESVELLDKLSPDIVAVTPGIRIYRGCELENIAIREGVIKPGQNLLEPVFYMSRAVEPWLYDYAVEISQERDGWDVEPLAQETGR